MSTDPQRRKLIKLAGASVALGSFGLQAGRAHAAAAGEVLDIAIIGAGLSGLTTARDLQLVGCDSFAVLEARDRVGGRTLNHDLGGSQVSDAGGQWIGPGQTVVADLARQLGVGTVDTYYEGKTVILGGDGRLAMDLKGGFGGDEAIAAKLSELARDVPAAAPWKSPRLAELDSMTLGEWLLKQGIKPQDRAGWDISALLTGGSSPSLTGLLQYLATINSGDSDFHRVEAIRDSAQQTRFVGGAQSLSLRMAATLGDRLRLSCPVRRISGWDQAIITLHTDQGELRARRVVMALHPALCQQIEFSPTLPEPRAALQRAWPAVAPLRKTAMVYSRPFWRDRGLNGHVLQFGGPLVWAYDNSPPRGEIGVINAFVQPGQLPSDPAEARRIQTEIYARALGREALKPLSYHDHDWATADPWAITCLPGVPKGFWTRHGEGLRFPCGNLVWSGAETAERWVGYMDGAVSAGHRAARQALHSLRHAGASA
jgi:monoamine oxidase